MISFGTLINRYSNFYGRKYSGLKKKYGDEFTRSEQLILCCQNVNYRTLVSRMYVLRFATNMRYCLDRIFYSDVKVIVSVLSVFVVLFLLYLCSHTVTTCMIWLIVSNDLLLSCTEATDMVAKLHSSLNINK